MTGAELIAGGIIVAAFTGLLGFVIGNRSTQQLKIDVARIAPTLAKLEVALESYAAAFLEHTRTEGHQGGMQRLVGAEKDIDRMGEKVRRHVEDRTQHNGGR